MGYILTVFVKDYQSSLRNGGFWYHLVHLGREAQGILGDVSGKFSKHPRPSLPVLSAGWSSASPAWLCQAAAEPELFPKIEIKNAFIDFF